MSNRYIDFSRVALGGTPRVFAKLQQPTNEKEQKRHNKIEDITEAPKKIWGNEAHRRKLRQMQDAMNYRNEIDRIRSTIHSGRVPGNREHLYLGRLRLLEQKLKYTEPLISESGQYHHIG
jgi:hypothetical protein